MKNKKQLVVSNIDDKRTKSEVDPDVEIIDEKTCQVEYDTSKLQIYAIDGVIPFVDSEEARFLFFTNYCDVDAGKSSNKKKKFYNSCVAELRMTPSTMKMIVSIINDELNIYERSQKKKLAIENGLKKQEQQLMFG